MKADIQPKRPQENEDDTLRAVVLRSAPMAELTRRAITDEANSVVDKLSDLIADDELRRSRKNKRRKKTQVGFRRALEAFVGDLLVGQTRKFSEGWTWLLTHRKHFTGREVTYANFKNVRDGLRALGMIEEAKGVQDAVHFDGGGEPAFARGWAPRFRATEKLLKFTQSHSVGTAEAGKHFVLSAAPKELIQVREAKPPVYSVDRPKGRKIDWRAEFRGKLLEEGEKLEAQLKELNEFLASVEIRGGGHGGYWRGYNGGRHPDFDWNRGGRLYSYGDQNYQNMPREERLRMTLNGEAVCEIDIHASYLTLYLAWHNKALERPDAYVLDGLGKDAREAVKTWFTITFGKEKLCERWSPKAKENYRKRAGRDLSEYPARLIRDSALRTYPPMQAWGMKDGDSWAKLMWHESLAVFFTMRDLMELGVPSLSVHDSLIVPLSKCEVAEGQLSDRYHWVCQFRPILKTHTSSSSTTTLS
jgi:hypothetical protein